MRWRNPRPLIPARYGNRRRVACSVDRTAQSDRRDRSCPPLPPLVGLQTALRLREAPGSTGRVHPDCNGMLRERGGNSGSARLSPAQSGSVSARGPLVSSGACLSGNRQRGTRPGSREGRAGITGAVIPSAAPVTGPVCVFQRTKREWRPLEDRSCTDLPWLLLFTVFCVGMVTAPAICTSMHVYIDIYILYVGVYIRLL